MPRALALLTQLRGRAGDKDLDPHTGPCAEIPVTCKAEEFYYVQHLAFDSEAPEDKIVLYHACEDYCVHTRVVGLVEPVHLNTRKPQ